jgi:hypothetical protein
MENFEEAIYTQSDDRCIPPSQQDCNSVGVINRMNNIANNELNEPNSSGTFIQHDENIKTIDVTQSLPNTDRNVDFLLTVENLNRIKSERQTTMGEKDSITDNLKNMSDRNVMTPSPTLKLEMKTESILITDALNLNQHGEKIPKDIESGVSEEDTSVKLESKRTEKERPQLTESSDTKVTNSTNKISTKSEHNYHKKEKEDSSKIEKDHR